MLDDDTPDWVKVINSLKNKGLTNEMIAGITGSTPSAINRIRNNGTEPRYAVGKKLIDLSKKYH